MIIASIDVGYINMALTVCRYDPKDQYPDFTFAEKVDITCPRHTTVPLRKCTIPHTCETCDRVAHFIQEFKPLLDSADHILIERQPIMGMKEIETLVMYIYRAKTMLISPNAMHKHFGISSLDYEDRKIKTTDIAREHVQHLKGFSNIERQHDIADAVCVTLYFIRDMHRAYNIQRLPFDEFRYVSKK